MSEKTIQVSGAYWKQRQAKELAKLDIEVTEDTPVCCTDVGSMMRVDNFETWWSNWRKTQGFDGLKFHELRHTQATVLLANGVDVKTVQTRLGHANPSITRGWYAHAIPENDHEAADIFGNLFSAPMSRRSDAEGSAAAENFSMSRRGRISSKKKAGQLI